MKIRPSLIRVAALIACTGWASISPARAESYPTVTPSPALPPGFLSLPDTTTSYSLTAPETSELLHLPPESSSGVLGTIIRTFGDLLLPIPDNSFVGVSHEPTVSTGGSGLLQSVKVSLTISSRGPEPMFNGDLYVTLRHGSGYSVLLNRVGRRADSSVGYADNGFQVTLADGAASDIHTYRVTLGGSDFVPISNADPATPLTGSWQPDGRTSDPESVLSTSPRSASLGSFAGLDPNGEWTLFLADLSPGGLAQLESWSLELTVVPEPSAVATMAASALLALALLRRHSARVRDPGREHPIP